MVSRFHLFHFFEEPEPDRGVPQGANANVSSFIAIRIKFQDILSFIDQKQGQDRSEVRLPINMILCRNQLIIRFLLMLGLAIGISFPSSSHRYIPFSFKWIKVRKANELRSQRLRKKKHRSSPGDKSIGHSIC